MLDRLRRLVGLSAPGAVAAPVAPGAPPVPVYGAWLPDASWVAKRRATGATYADLDAEAVTRASTAMPAVAAGVIRAAECALRHEFDLLGSGPFVPVDPDRPASAAYQPIDWYLDPVRQLRFPRGVHHKAWNLYEMRPGNADVKYPWELARCQHWVTLGQAYRLTGDERFAVEVAAQLDDFVAANPVGVGINWTCTMDVGLRAVSWVVALDLVRGSTAIEAGFWPRAYAALFDHGLFIRGNLENTYEVTSNHFLSNVVGLWFLAAVFTSLDEGRAWSEFARASLETEIDVQVLPDGADFESSVPYHRLVAELFLGCARLAEHRGQPLSARYRGRVADMVEYLACVTRPDGLMPQSGDADDGRLHVCGGVSVTTPQDGRHLLGPAAVMFGRDEWLALGGEAAAWEAAWWGVPAPTAPAAAVPSFGRLFPDAGHAVARDGGLYLLITNSIVGTKGFGNHKHNDQLGFEYHLNGAPLVVDPGSYVYTSDPVARNLFRGTAYHNTLMVDGVEQNEINPEWLFRAFEQARAEHVSFRDDGRVVDYRGRHVGYTRLPEPVTHERHFRLDRASGRLDIQDQLTGSGRHRLEWHFHFAPGTVVTPEPGACRLETSETRAVLQLPEGMALVVKDVWYSPSYGVKVPCQAATVWADATIDGSATWRFALIPGAFA